MKVRRRAAGYYEIDTDEGTHTIVRLVVTRGMDGFGHRRCGTYWMHTPAGEFTPSGDFFTLTEAVAYVGEHFTTSRHEEHTMTDVYAALIHSGARDHRWRMTLYAPAYPGARSFLPSERSPWFDVAVARERGLAWLAERGFRVLGTGHAITGGYRYDLTEG